MLRDLEPLDQEVKKIELRRDYEGRRHGLEKELRTARADQLRQVRTPKSESNKKISFHLKFRN